MNNLTPKQKAFADYFIELGQAEPAAIKAGYSAKYARGNAHKLVANSGIKQYIDKRMKELDAKRIAGADEVLQYLTGVMRGEIKDQFELDASLQDRTKAAELLAKRYRLFDNKSDRSEDTDRALEKLDEVLSEIKGVI